MLVLENFADMITDPINKVSGEKIVKTIKVYWGRLVPMQFPL